VILTDHHHQSFYREKEPEEEKTIKEKKGSKLPTYTYLFNFFSSNAAIRIFVTPANHQPKKLRQESNLRL
jgi:hypothetical protein